MSDMLKEATARPWRNGKDISDDTIYGSFRIVQTCGGEKMLNAANARLIVTAVNSYEPMLAALEAMVAGKHYHKASDGDPDTCHRCGENFRSSKHFRGGESEASLIDDAKAAIAIAKGETQ